MEHKLAWQSLVPHLRSLRLIGTYQLDPQTTPKYLHQLHKVYMRFMFCLPLIYSCQSCIYIYQERKDLYKVVDTMFLMLSFIASMFKQLIFWLKTDRVDKLLDILKGSSMNPNVEHYKVLLVSTSKRAKATLYVFYCLSQMSVICWVTFPTLVRLSGDTTELAFWLPFDKEKYFHCLMVYIYLQTSLLGLNSVTVDVLLAFLLVQCKTQLFILRSNLEILVESKKSLSENPKTSFQKLFKSCIRHHIDIMRLANGFNDTFGDVLFFQFLLTGWIICMTAYRCININPISVEFSSLFLYLCCILTEAFLFCYYGNELTYESEQLTNSVYKMDWLNTTVEERRSLLIFMERIKQPIQPLAGKMIPLSLGTFISILRSSYSLYAFLKTTEE